VRDTRTTIFKNETRKAAESGSFYVGSDISLPTNSVLFMCYVDQNLLVAVTILLFDDTSQNQSFKV
jgi:hypothetical protein